MLTRRTFVSRAGAIAFLSPLSAIANNPKRRLTRKFMIGACDWSLGKSCDPEAFTVAKEIGIEGLMVNMGTVGDNMHLRQKQVQQQYIRISAQTGVKIASMAIGELNNIPYKSDPRTEEWVWDSIDVAGNLGITVILLAFFGKNDLRNDKKGIEEVIRRLKRVAPKAEKAGVILGVESYLDAAGHLEIIERTGSPNVKAYVDFRNTADAGYDVIKEVRAIGSRNICELHMKENGVRLGDGTLPWEGIRRLLDEIGYYGDGWMQIEGANRDGDNLIASYKHNLAFLQKLFNEQQG